MKFAWLMFLLIMNSALAETPRVEIGFVIKVYDGDTATVVSCGGIIHKVRLAKIDAPELKQDFGHEAKTCLSDKILNRRVQLHIISKDMYKRDVGEIFMEGNSVNNQMVEEGCAWVYEQYNDDFSLKGLQDKARLSRKGLWDSQSPIPPWAWRKLQKEQRKAEKELSWNLFL